MAKVVIIGGSGHVGTYLVPMLVEAGHEVTNVSRGRSTPYQQHPAWAEVRTATVDRTAEEAAGTFGQTILALEGEIVIDMICFTQESCEHLVRSLRGEVGHFLHCGTIWVYGHNATVPATEDQPLNAFGAYGLGKQAIETWLLNYAQTEFPVTVFRPGHIVGPGWVPLNPAGNFNADVFWTIATGEDLVLPNFGLETVHHVHAADVAQLVMRCIQHKDNAVGEAFNAVSAQAVNLRGYAEAMYRRFGHDPAGKLSYLPFEQWRATQKAEDAEATWEHISRSPCHSIEKARRYVNYEPAYSSLAAVDQALTWLIDNGHANP